MSKTIRLIFALTVLCTSVWSQRFVDDECTLESTGLRGVCKLLSNCPPVRKELQELNKFPQTCGFQGTQPIVCCPQTENRPPVNRPPVNRPPVSRPPVNRPPVNPPPVNRPARPPSSRQPGVMSRRKCREYGKYVYEESESPVLMINRPTSTKKVCGHEVEKLIVGGAPAGRIEFPHMAAIGFESSPGNILWGCGGTILSKQYILTAAHCLREREYGVALWVKLGVATLTDTNHLQQIRIAERIAFPQYRSTSNYHDIGLLKLEKEANLNPYARPACLYLEPEVTTEKAIATGWGKTMYAGDSSNSLQKVTIDLFNNTYCNSFYKNQKKVPNGILNDIQLCAGSENEEKDTCQGDSGGPLQIYHIGDRVTCMHDIIGVTSFGKGCNGSPGVYVRVSNYISWIEDIVWP